MAWHLYARGTASGVYLQNVPFFPTNLKADLRWGFNGIWNISVIFSNNPVTLEFTLDAGVTWLPLNGDGSGGNSPFGVDIEIICNVKAEDKELFNLRCTDVGGCTAYRVLVSIAPQDIQRRSGEIQTVAAFYQTIEDEGITLPQQPILNFVGSGVTATDDAGNLRTDVTIPDPQFMIGYHTDKAIKKGGGIFASIFTNKADQGAEIEGTGAVPLDFTIKRMVVRVGINTTDTGVATLSARINGVDSIITTFAIPNGTTGTFDTGIITDSLVALDTLTIHGVADQEGAGNKVTDYAVFLRCDNV